jgi:tetrahydromethanopterin S-methyltransferase subunit G
MAFENSTSKRGSFTPEDEVDQLLAQAVIRLNGHIFGLVLGLVAGITLFLATNFLVLKGGDVVGPHLSLLSQFFLGYSVTFIGSLIGFAYGLVTGYIAGFVIAAIYNLVVRLKNN